MEASVAVELDGPLWLGERALAELLTPAHCVAALEAALAAAGALAAGGHRALAYEVEGGVFHVKTAAIAGPRAVFVSKVNANFPGNPRRGLPTIQGVAALFDATDGRLLALLDSPELTALRTGAATAVAARRLARPDSRSLLVCGCGRQARAQIAALAVVLPLGRVACLDLVPERAAAVADWARRELGCEAAATADLDGAARASDLIVTCTTASSPFLGLDQVSPGTFVAAVGADNPGKQELDSELVARSVVVVDSPEQAAAAGELRHALASGRMSAEDVHARLDQLVTGERPGRTGAGQITLFDSTGIALEDAAAALAAYERAMAAGAAGAADAT